MSLFFLFLIFLLIILASYCYNNKVRIHFDTFFKPGIKLYSDDYGLFVFYAVQGGGKTYSCIEILKRFVGHKKIITNCKSFSENYKKDVIFEDNFENLISFLLSQNDLSDYIVFYDEIFSYFSDFGLPDNASDVFTQLRKKHLYFFTTSQLWTELPPKFRKLCRYEVSCRIKDYFFLPFSILINECNDGYAIKWDKDSQEFSCPRLWTSIKKANRSVVESYDTYESVSHIKPSSSAAAFKRQQRKICKEVVMNYYFSLKKDDFTYTIDMIRLKTYISSEKLHEIKPILDSNCPEFFTNHGFGKFALNYKFFAVWVGIGTINPKKDGKIIFCIEFNPNKMNSLDVQFLQWILKSFDFTVTRYDLAIDIPYNINNLYFGDLYKKSFSMFYTDYNNKTFYFGKGSGHTKIYNKTIESKLDYELTRYEVTIETDFDFRKGLIPAFNTNFISILRQPYFSYGGDSTVDAILYALNAGFPFKQLSRRYKEVIKKDFVGLNDIDIGYAYVCLCKFMEKLRFDLC